MTILSRIYTGVVVLALVGVPVVSAEEFGGSFGGSFEEPADTDTPPVEASGAEADPQGAGGPAAASTGEDFGGSFDESPGGGSGDDGFGGSFEDDDADLTATEPEGTAEDTGSPDSDDGAFDPDFSITEDETLTEPGEETPPEPEEEQKPQEAPQMQAVQVDPQILAFESRDFGEPATDELRQGQFHAPTPTSLPGGAVVSTEGLAIAINEGMRMVVIDVLGGEYSLPNAFMATAMASPGSYQDRVQQQTIRWLQQITGGDQGVPIIVYCSDPQCWLSYNAALRAIAAGYTNVYWYRGGITAWQMAGLPVSPSSY